MRQILRRGDGGGANVVGELDGGTDIGDAKAIALQDFLIDAGVQIGEAFGKLYLLTIDGDRAEGGFATRDKGEREIGGINREKPADTGILQLDKTRHAFGITVKDLYLSDSTKKPLEQVKEMDTDVGGNATGLFLAALPGGVIPGATGGDVGEDDIMLGMGACQLVFERQ